MADIFVSYSHKDADFGRRLHHALISQKRDVWMDWEDIPFSADWWQEIRQGIEASDNFIIILSTDFISSPVCMLEVEHARNNNKRILIVSLNLSDFATASSALEERVKTSATLQQLLAGRDIQAIARENWGTIGHVNWLIFEDDAKFDESFRLLTQTLDTDLEHVRGHTHLQVKALDWEESKRNWSFLLTGVQIDNAEAWLKKADEEHKNPQVTELQREFIKASRQQQIEQEEHIERMQNRAKQFRRVSMVAGVIAALITIAGIALTIWTGIQVTNAETQQALANEQVQIANATVESANEQVAMVGSTLTPIGATLAGAENARAIAETQVVQANTQAAQAEIVAQNAEAQVHVANSTVESANATLTPVVIALTQGAVEQAKAQTEIADIQNVVATANIESTSSAKQLNDAGTQIAAVSIQVEQANATVDSANATLTPVAMALTQGAIDQEQAQTQVFVAENQAAEANAASTTSAQQLGTADAEINVAEMQIQVANATVNSANATLTPIGPTLTKAGEDLASANLQVTEAAKLVVTAETQVAAAGTQVANANFSIATAEQEVSTSEAKAKIVEATAIFSGNQAQSQSLIVNAEQAALNGDVDLALALVQESYKINPNLAQTRRLLNDIAYSSARFIFDDKPFVVFSPDSSKIAYPDGNDIVIADIATRTEVMRLSGHSDTVTTGDFSPDGQFFASGSKDTTIIIWNMKTGKIERTLTEHIAPIIKLVYDPTGTRIASIAEDETAIIWRVDLSYSGTVFSADDGIPFTDVRFTGDGSRFIVWGAIGSDTTIYFWQSANPRSLNKFVNQNIFRVFNLDSLVASRAMSYDDKRLTVYNSNNRQVYRDFVTGFNWNTDRAGIRTFDPSGNKVLVALSNVDGSENRLILLDTATSATELEYEGTGKDRVTALAYSPDGQTVLSGNGRYLILWDANTGKELKRFGAHLDDVVEITFSADSNHAISRSRDGNIRVWDVDSTDPAVIVQIQTASGDPAANPSFSPDNSQVFFRVGDIVYRYDVKTLREIQSPFSYFSLQNIFYSSTEPYAVTSSDSIARMWDATLPPLQAALWADNRGGESGETIDSIGTFSKDGNWIAISMSHYIRAYDVSSPCCPQSPIRFDRSAMDVSALAFSPDDKYLYIAVNKIDDTETFAVIQWNLETQESGVIQIPHIRPIRSIDISSGGKKLLTASEDQTIVLWDIENGVLLRRLAGHHAAVNHVFFGSNDLTAISSSDDASIILWDLDSGQSIRRYIAENAITGLAINHDGTMAISTDGTNLVTLWKIETLAQVIAWVQNNREIPPLTPEQCSQFRVQCS